MGGILSGSQPPALSSGEDGEGGRGAREKGESGEGHRRIWTER